MPLSLVQYCAAIIKIINTNSLVDGGWIERVVLCVRWEDTSPRETVDDSALEQDSAAADVGQSHPLSQVASHRLQNDRLELRMGQVSPNTEDQGRTKSVRGGVCKKEGERERERERENVKFILLLDSSTIYTILTIISVSICLWSVAHSIAQSTECTQ